MKAAPTAIGANVSATRGNEYAEMYAIPVV